MEHHECFLPSFQDLLRSLPDCLLMCGHYAEWIQLAEAYADNKAVDPVKRLVDLGILGHRFGE